MTTLKPHRKNPNIANVFSQMGIVEELGSGTKKMFRYTSLFSKGKDPQIDEQDVYRITIPYESESLSVETTEESGPEVAQKWPENWPEPKVRIINAIIENPNATVLLLEDQLSIGHTTIKKYLTELQKEGILKRQGAKKGGYWECLKS